MLLNFMPSRHCYSVSTLDPKSHRREMFDCGVAALNDYLKERAGQDVRRFAAGCWVMTGADDPGRILGFYTLSAEAVDVTDMPELPAALGRKLPRYRRLGAILLGRLAVATELQGRGLGKLLLLDALHRCLSSEIPAVLVLVDPKDDAAAAFYAKFGFRRLNACRMFVATSELSEWLASQD
jgi:GNAT superfamily N-acetyltransferase